VLEPLCRLEKSQVPISPEASDAFEQIHCAAKLIMEPGAVHELRIPKAGRERTISGYFDDPLKLAQYAAELDATGKYAGIYITLNPCNPALLARCCNRVQPHAEVTTSDHDILKRHWLLVDCDPKRPAGISSTEKEHGRAITTACGTWDDLRGAGFGDPVVADSGNGGHLLYRLDLPNDQHTTNLIQQVLSGIAGRCAPDDIDIDLSVYNAARICKLYGTMARKGDSISDRPHRRSRVLEIPTRLEILRLERS
jgi:hypothetical protein